MPSKKAIRIWLMKIPQNQIINDMGGNFEKSVNSSYHSREVAVEQDEVGKDNEAMEWSPVTVGSEKDN